MRTSLFFLLSTLLMFSYGIPASAQTNISNTFTKNFSLGSQNVQVTALQKILNQDPDTRIATTGPGSPGNETSYFGQLTKAAVVRFQEKYANEILTPVGLSQGNGYVGSYTRAKLNVLPPLAVGVKSTSSPAAPITIPDITAAEVPSAAIGTPSPHSGIPGTYVSIKGFGISLSSVVYFGSNYIVRKVSKGFGDDFIFVVPPIPTGRYDIMVRTGGAISNTTMFVITDPKNPLVRLENISPATIKYGDTLTITGSGFSPTNNVVVTTYQTFTNVPSTDGTTLTVQVAPASLQTSARIGDGKIMKPMSLYVVSDYGFSDSAQSFTMIL